MGYTNALLSSSIGGDFYVGMTIYLPGSDQYEDTLLKHVGEVHDYVIEGELEVYMADEKTTLH